MIIEIKKDLEINLEQGKIEVPKELEEKINLFWEDITKKQPTLWDGEDYFAQKFIQTSDKLIITCKKSKYSHYLYDEKIGIEDERYWSSCVWGGILLKTLDDFFVIGEMADTTSFPGCLQIPGGGIDKLDFEDSKLNYIKLIARELKEEVNLELNNINHIKNYKVKYLELPEGKRHAYGILAVGNLNMTRKEMEDYYLKYKEDLERKNGEIEFKELKFLPVKGAVEFLKNMNNPKRAYLIPFLELEEEKI